MQDYSNDGERGKFKKASRADSSDPAYLRGETRQERRGKFEYKVKDKTKDTHEMINEPAPDPAMEKKPTFRSTVQGEMSAYRKANPGAVKGSLGFQQARSSALDKAKGLLSGKVTSRQQMKLDRSKKRLAKLTPTPTPTPIDAVPPTSFAPPTTQADKPGYLGPPVELNKTK